MTHCWISTTLINVAPKLLRLPPLSVLLVDVPLTWPLLQPLLSVIPSKLFPTFAVLVGISFVSSIAWFLVLFPSHEKMPAHAAACICFEQGQRVQVDVHDHVGCFEPHGGIRVHHQIIEELFGLFCRACCAFGLLDCNGAEGHQYCDVDSVGIV